MSTASPDKVRAWREQGREVPRIECDDPDQRAELEADDEAWILHFFPETFYLPFGEPHRELIAAVRYAVDTGGRVALAAPRGMGKSAILWALSMKYASEQRARFPAYIPWAGPVVKRAMRFWKNCVSFNAEYARLYPEVAAPFAQARGVSQRLLSLIWADDGSATGAQIRTTDGMIVLPDGIGVIGSATVNGNPRGLNHPTETGEILRPDFAMLDDVQDKETARSERQTKDVIDVIDSDVMGMAGPGRKMPAALACTVLKRGDVASHYLGDETPDWQSIRVQQIVEWPKNRELWDDWNVERLEGEVHHDGGARGIAFYNEHGDKLREGLEVSWEHRYDADKGQPDAYYAAMLDFYQMGEAAFMAERQNDPLEAETSVFDLTAKLILSRTSEVRVQGEVAADTAFITAATDVNHYGLHWAAIGFRGDMTGQVARYGVHGGRRGGLVPKNVPEQERDRLIFEALTAHGERLANMTFDDKGDGRKLDLWLIDGGYAHATVQRYAQNVRLPFPVMVSRGYGFANYRPFGKSMVGKPKECCHMAKSDLGRWVAFNADYWREVMQRAWLGLVDAPGSLSLFCGKNHTEIADQVCRERLVEKMQGRTGIVWKWNTAPGWHDYGDALYMCYVAAAWLGLSATGVPRPRRKRKGKGWRLRT